MFAGGARPVVPFFTAGFPTRAVFRDSVRAALDAGAGALEIGMPFSDPLADGPAIQHSSQVALDNGVTMDHVFEMAAEVRSMSDCPILLMGYLNPLLRRGMDRFAYDAAVSGADGTIIPDCPIEEASNWIAASKEAGLANVFLVAPTSPTERIRRIDRLSTSFSYCVSIAGVTGARRDVSASTIAYLRRVRQVAKKPFVVGFGISQPSNIRSLSGLADGYVVGSALVPLLDGGSRQKAAKKVAHLIGALAKAASDSH